MVSDFITCFLYFIGKRLSSLQSECGLRSVGLEAVLDDGLSIHVALVAGPGKLLHIVITGSDKPAPPIALRLASFLQHSVEEDVSRLLAGTGEGGDRERLLYAAALYMVYPAPENEVMKHVKMLAGGRADSIAALVWRIAFGEGYTFESWAELLDSLRTLSAWECIALFQYLALRGLRRKHKAEPIELEDREVLRAACKLLGIG